MTRLLEVRSLARAVAVAGLALAALVAAPAGAATITLSNSPAVLSNETPCPRTNGSATAAIPVNAFQVRADVASTQVDRVLLKFVPADAYANLDRIEIRSADGATLYGGVIPTTELFWVSLAVPLPVTASDVTFHVTVSPRQHGDMPPPSIGRSQAVQVHVLQALSFAPGNTVTGSDTVSATVTVDNGSPANLSWAGITAGASNVLLDWAGSPDPSVLVLRREYGPVEDVPAEGATYGAGAFAGGTSLVRYSAAGPQFDDTGLTGNRPYYYRLFVKDACNNYSSGTNLGPIFPGGSGEGDLTLNSTKPVVGIVNPGNGPATRPFKVQIRVFSPNDAAITEVRLYGNNGAGDVLLGKSTGASPLVTKNTNYESPVSAASGMFEFTANSTTLAANGTWTLRAWAANSGVDLLPSAGVYSGGVGVIVGTAVGDGRLLVRDNSSQMCSDCHAAKSHSAETTGMGLGSWYVGCRSCHEPHGTTNAKLIAREITPPSVNGAQAPQAVYFTGATGNQVGGKANPSGTGLCQVCHTRTQFYRRGVANETHGDGAACATCHSHQEGQKASCSSCHGDKNRILVAGADILASAAPPNAAAPVGGNDVGAHQAHVNRTTLRRAPLQCASCHTIPNTHQGSADVLSFVGMASFGTTPIWNAGGSQCSTVYCHGGSAANPFDGNNRSPSWTTPTTLDCQSCHLSPPQTQISDGSTHTTDSNCSTCHGAGYDVVAGISGGALDTHIDTVLQASNCTGCHGTEGVNAAPPVAAAPVGANNVGAHQAHVVNTNVRSAPLACSDCHGLFPAFHNNSSQNVSFGTLARTEGMTPDYLGSTTPATPTCTATYCHAGAAGGLTPAPSWLATGPFACNSCHANSPNYPHPQNQACSDCHPSGGGQTYSKATATTGTVVKATHLDGTVTKSSSACTSCHGLLSAVGVTLVANTESAAPGFDAGSRDSMGGTLTTAPAVGAHQKHLAGTSLRSVGAASCVDCHVLPPTDADQTHATGSGTGGARATLVFTNGFANTGGKVSSYSGSTSATTNTAAGSCATTYCHGAFSARGAAYTGTNMAPVWTQTTAQAAACGTCHQAPPNTAAHDTVRAGSTRQCSDCHTGYNCTTDTLAACLPLPAAHLDGTFSAPSMTCSSCHGTNARAANTTNGTIDALEDAAPPRDAAWLAASNQVGPHLAHVNPASASQIMRPIACSECHGSGVNTYTTSHANGATDVTFANATFANLRTFSPLPSAGNPYGCSTYCHDNPAGGGGSVATWTWNTTTTADCGSCHGAPPPGAIHVSVAAAVTECVRCHNTTANASGGIIISAAGATPHIDGAATLGGVSCRSCHGSATNDAPPAAANSANGNAVGAHQSHVTTGNIANGLACTTCHPAVGPTAYNHANGTVNMAFTGTAGTGTTWNAATPATSSCSTSWCHGGTASQSAWGRANTDPLWNTVNGSFQNCNSCHGAPPPLNATTRHPQNLVAACTSCHPAGYLTTGITGAAALASHVDGTVQADTGCTACHGDLSTPSGQPNTAAAAAPGYNGVGVNSTGSNLRTVRTVGAHDPHVRGTTFRAEAIACRECHSGKVPADGDKTHVTGTVDPLLGGTLATSTAVGTTPTLTWNGTTCANTYCHGNFKNGNNVTVTWAGADSVLDCNSCHGRGTGATPTAPIGTAQGGTHSDDATCTNCHLDYTGGANLDKHINGQVDYKPGLNGCSICHQAPPTTMSRHATFNGAMHPQNSVCVTCHGAGYTPPAFTVEPTNHNKGSILPGTDGPNNGCTACHGVLAGPTAAGVAPGVTAAPGYNDLGVDTLGSTTTGNRGVGAHDGHVRKTNFRSAALACTQCHFGSVMPAAGNVSHADGTAQTAFDPALAASAGAVTWNGTTCSATYCHGNFTNGAYRLPAPGAPAAPGAAPTFASVTSSTLTVNWTASAGATVYKVLRSTTSGSGYVQVGTATGTTFNDVGLLPSTNYYYVIRAWNTGGESGNSAQGTTTTTAAGVATTYDLAPQGAVNLTTDGSTNIIAQQSYIYAIGGTAPTQRAIGVTGYTRNTTTQGRVYRNNTLAANTTYHVVGFYTPALTASNNAVAANVAISIDYVNRLTSTGSGTYQATLYEYNDATGNVASRGTYTSTALNTSTTARNTVSGTFNNTAFTAAAGNRLKVEIRLVTGGTALGDTCLLFGATQANSGTAGASRGFSTVTPTLSAGTPPAPSTAPTGLAFSNVGSSSLTLSWNAVAGATTYRVERGVGATPASWAQVAETTGTAIDDRGLTGNTVYTYRVTASTAGGNGPVSGTATQTTPALPPPGVATWAGSYAPGSTTLTCSSCHGSPPGGTHPANATCATCHPTYTASTVDPVLHINGVINVDCVGCHSSPQGSRGAVASEFSMTWSHKRSASGRVNRWDCIVCHMEGSPSTGDRTAVHADGNINLRDPDTGLNIKQVQFTGALGGTAAGSYGPVGGDPDMVFTTFRRNLAVALENDPDKARVQAIMVNQCMKCHDANGAQAFAGSNPLSVMATGTGVDPTGATTNRTAFLPFGTAISYGAIAAADGGTGTRPSGTGVTAGGLAGGVIDVNESFKATNSSYHPISGRNNNRFVYANRAASPFNTGISGRVTDPTSGTTNNFGYLLSCWDCHAANGTTSATVLLRTVTAHGGTSTVRGRPATSGTTPDTTNPVTLCGVCHTRYENCGGATNSCAANLSHGTGSAFNTDANGGMEPYLRFGCNRCHSATYTETTSGYAVRPVRAQDGHGVNALPTAGTKTGRWSTGGTNADARPYAFIRNTTSLSNHQPAQTTNTGGTTATYTPTCVHLVDGDCNSRTETYTPGGRF